MIRQIRRAWILLLATVLLGATIAAGEEATIHVDASHAGRPVSHNLTGACIEDVNHEIYGGIYSQMIFGESFQEPARTAPVKGFFATDGQWRVRDGEVSGGSGAGPKLISSSTSLTDGEAGVEIFLSGDANTAGNAGLIVHVNKAGAGADNFDGYEIAIDAARKRLLIGRHRHDFHLLKEVPCDIPVDRWISLSVKLAGGKIEAFIDGKSLLQVQDERPLRGGSVGLRPWQRTANFRNLWVKSNDPNAKKIELSFEPGPDSAISVSGMWAPISTGTAVLEAAGENERPFIGVQSQRITFARGEGEAGIENRGLNRQGIGVVAAKPYEGYLWARADKPIELLASLESGDGSHSYARKRLTISSDQWRRYEFALTPDTSDTAARFSLRLSAAGSVVIGHVFLQPGEWGRFKRLPLRRDVVEGLIDQGVTVLRYGGSMVNEPQYRWKKMIGPRDLRPPYHGTWYAYSSNGWGIIDFLNLCEAAGFLAIPDFNLGESPQDMADFIEYVNGPKDSPWGRKRVADGHPEPYHLRYLELGNEEHVDETYYAKFEPLVKAIWAKDPAIVPIVGDFQYEKPIVDPMHIEGAASHITSLAAHRKILDLARQNNAEVWFDVHVWTEKPRTSSALALKSYVDAIDQLAGGARHSVVVFEFNANRHDIRRALANADAIAAIVRDGRIPVALSANGLQVDGQNDNGWDQGLLFLNSSKVWLQPPGYVTQMISRTFQPELAETRVGGAGDTLTATATRSADGKRLVLQVLNLDAKPAPAKMQIAGLVPSGPAMVEELAGALDATNSASKPDQVKPRRFEWRYEPKDGAAAYILPPNSLTVFQFEQK